MKLIDKDALVAEIKSKFQEYWKRGEESDVLQDGNAKYWGGVLSCLNEVKTLINTLEVKEVDEQKERINECPCRQVVCTMYTDKILECNGACSWVVDYPKLKELKVQKGE